VFEAPATQVAEKLALSFLAIYLVARMWWLARVASSGLSPIAGREGSLGHKKIKKIKK